MRIGLFTGTFDPVHLGHVAMARAAMAAARLDEVWFLVNPDPGHKAGVTSYDDRIAMVKLAVAQQAGISAYEGNLASKMHHFDVFLTLINEHPSDVFMFIVGADVLAGMRAWESYAQVLEAAPQFVAARRSGGSEPELDERLPVQWFELNEHAAASSRDIRMELAAGKPPSDLDPAVLAYIREHGLYR
ncbi:MAG TPA: nicotinate-nicotinamide nucleotide adenylyltransferase [Candidatus Saccharimonadia bacterium]|jgi:nicotinate-nucleotide adenylyltransferase|nr:nicotinate-nicotinamide nucleotide adenylyltransferase [Candidatus Saccharimonadia bacterium]